MGIDSGKGKLDPCHGGIVAAREQRLPALWCAVAREPIPKRSEVQVGKPDIQFSQPRRILKAASSNPCRHRGRYLKVQPVELFQTVAIRQNCVQRPHDGEYAWNAFGRSLNRCEQSTLIS